MVVLNLSALYHMYAADVQQVRHRRGTDLDTERNKNMGGCNGRVLDSMNMAVSKRSAVLPRVREGHQRIGRVLQLLQQLHGFREDLVERLSSSMAVRPKRIDLRPTHLVLKFYA